MGSWPRNYCVRQGPRRSTASCVVYHANMDSRATSSEGTHNQYSQSMLLGYILGKMAATAPEKGQEEDAVHGVFASDDRDDLSMAYTPGVARVCTAIADQPDLASTYTWVANTVAVVS